MSRYTQKIKGRQINLCDSVLYLRNLQKLKQLTKHRDVKKEKVLKCKALRSFFENDLTSFVLVKTIWLKFLKLFI